MEYLNDIEARIAAVFDCYEAHGNDDYIGEDISQIEHMCQAAQLAEAQGYDEEVILAAFFHDIGHICPQLEASGDMGGYGRESHEKIGANFLRKLGFPERIAKLVENHVQAKRFLTFVDPDYYSKLSLASKKTLEFQGGPMTAEEAEKFKNDPQFGVSIKMREWDEAAKEVGIPLPDLAKYEEMAKRVLR